MTVAILGRGTLLKQGATTIGQRMKIDGPDIKVGTAPATHLDSTAVEKRGTIPDSGDLSLTLLYNPADTTHQLLTAQLAAAAVSTDGGVVAWTVEYPDGSTQEFSGILTGFKPTGIEVDKLIEAECKIEITGEVTFTPGP
jgi:hypothetical protein